MFLVLGDVYCVLHILAVTQADAGSYLHCCFFRRSPCFGLALHDLQGAVTFSEPSVFAHLGSSDVAGSPLVPMCCQRVEGDPEPGHWDGSIAGFHYLDFIPVLSERHGGPGLWGCPGPLDQAAGCEQSILFLAHLRGVSK